MKDCKREVKITGHATAIDVTPDSKPVRRSTDAASPVARSACLCCIRRFVCAMLPWKQWEGFMDEVTRRGLVGGLVAAGATGLAGVAVAAPAKLQLKDLKKEGDVACIYHCDFGDTPRMMQLLNNISNHYSVYDADPFAIQLVIVAHSAGIKYFLTIGKARPGRRRRSTRRRSSAPRPCPRTACACTCARSPSSA